MQRLPCTATLRCACCSQQEVAGRDQQLSEAEQRASTHVRQLQVR